jgi:hypothetical protein
MQAAQQHRPTSFIDYVCHLENLALSKNRLNFFWPFVESPHGTASGRFQRGVHGLLVDGGWPAGCFIVS